MSDEKSSKKQKTESLKQDQERYRVVLSDLNQIAKHYDNFLSELQAHLPASHSAVILPDVFVVTISYGEDGNLKILY